jgi:hypothetical protein
MNLGKMQLNADNNRRNPELTFKTADPDDCEKQKRVSIGKQFLSCQILILPQKIVTFLQKQLYKKQLYKKPILKKRLRIVYVRANLSRGICHNRGCASFPVSYSV